MGTASWTSTALDAALAERPAVVSVMWVNNEVGVVQPVAEIAARCHSAGVIFHSDAVQAFGKLPVDVGPAACTLLTISGHKIGAPKGIGALIVRDGRRSKPSSTAAASSAGSGPGTENVAGAVALGCAARLAVAEQPAEAERLARACETSWRAAPGGRVPDVRRQCRSMARALRTF